MEWPLQIFPCSLTLGVGLQDQIKRSGVVTASEDSTGFVNPKSDLTSWGGRGISS